MPEVKNIVYYLTAIGLFILLKFVFVNADNNDLTFLLSPTNTIVELLTGSQSVFVQENGYFYKQLNIFIDKSCSGFNFWLLCFIMLTFLSIKYFDSNKGKTLALILSFISAYFITILVNSSRIFASVIIQNQYYSFFKQSIVHESIGIVINLTFLILIYLIVEGYLIRKNLK